MSTPEMRNDVSEDIKNKSDLSKKRTKRGKEKIGRVTGGNAKAACLCKRRNTLIRNCFKLHIMTGANVLLVVETEKGRRFAGTGNLREEYLKGKLQSKGSKEVKEQDVAGKVLPLAKTPSPNGPNQSETPLSRIGQIVRLSTSTKRGLNQQLSSVPTRVLDVLTDKANPVIVSSDKASVQSVVQNID